MVIYCIQSSKYKWCADHQIDMAASETIFLVEQKKEEAHAHAQSHIIIKLCNDKSTWHVHIIK